MMIHGTNTYNKAAGANSNNHNNPGGDHPLDSLFDDLIVTDNNNNNDYLSLGSVIVNPNQSHQSLSEAANNSNNTNHEKTKAQLKNKSKFDIYLPNI
jgi:hypothetical protein